MHGRDKVKRCFSEDELERKQHHYQTPSKKLFYKMYPIKKLILILSSYTIVVVGGVGTACISHAKHKFLYNISTSTDTVRGTITLHGRVNEMIKLLDSILTIR